MKEIVRDGNYTVEDLIAVVDVGGGTTKEVSLMSR